MKFYGNAHFQQGGSSSTEDTLAVDGSAQLQNAVLGSLTTFSTDPRQGQIAFVNSTVFICVSVAGSLPVWVPMTREITAYTHAQGSTATTWNINHNLNTTSVNIQIFDSSSNVIIPDAVYTIDSNNAVATFNSAQQGRAVVVTGYFDGNAKPTYNYTYYQSSAATTWTIVHNLGYNPIVRVFIGNQEVQPATITFNSPNEVTLTFSTAQAGYARLI